MGHTLGKRSRSTLLSVCFAVALAAAVLLSNASAAPAPARHAKAAPAKAAPAKAAHAHAQPKFLPVPRPRPRTAAAEVAPAAAAAAPAADKAADKAPAADKADTADKAAPADKAPAAAKADKAALADKAPVADKAAPADKAEKAADAKAPLDKWRDASAPLAARVSDLLSRLTLDEKLQMLTNKHMAVPRLGVKFFDLLNECLHGYWEPNPYTKQPPTIFPQPLVMASTFDRDLVKHVFTAISDEMRAKNNEQMESKGANRALTCWTPHMNIFRDPRWGRGSETWGEDPQLAATMAAHVVEGLQGDDKDYLKVAATCKHFFGYSFEMADGQSRFSFDAKISPVDAMDTYLPAFDACIRAANASGIMCAYNAVDGTPMCANRDKIDGLLRNKWGFQGYVVSDCNAVSALEWGHKTASSDSKAIAQALKGGTDVLCDNMDAAKAASQALAAGDLSEADIDRALNRTLAVRFLTGQFDAPSANPWSKIGLDVVNGAKHKELAKAAAHKGMVLLKNVAVPPATTKLLPLNKAALKKVCVLGPLADATEHMLGNYYGAFDKKMASPLQAIKSELRDAGVDVSFDNTLRHLALNYYDWPLESALQACKGAQAAIVFVGASMINNAPPKPNEKLSVYRPVSEGEGLDRESLSLPGKQMDLAKALALRAPDVPIVLVVMNGGPVDVSWAQASPQVGAILAAGLPGQEGAWAIRDVLFGKVNPSGRLPNTWYKEAYLRAAPYTDMGMRADAARGYPGRTYRFVNDSSLVLYPFGYGLSYTTFGYSDLRVVPVKESGGKCAGLSNAIYCASVTVTNTGSVAGEEVVMLYVSNAERAGTGTFPLKSLRTFTRTRNLAPGASQTLQLPLRTSDFAVPREDGASVVRLGEWRVAVGPLSEVVRVTKPQLDLTANTIGWAAQSPASA